MRWAKMGPFLTKKARLFLVVDEGAEEVGREEVRGELDPLEPRVHGACQGGDGERFGQPRHPLQEDVPSGDEPEEQPLHHALLPDDGTRRTSVRSGSTNALWCSIRAANSVISTSRMA
jgi:hypothetical protein